jgi:hypothetical protein
MLKCQTRPLCPSTKTPGFANPYDAKDSDENITLRRYQWRIYRVDWVDLSTGPRAPGVQRGPLVGENLLGAVLVMCQYYKKK